jgi:hypothetical protein
MDSLLVTGRGRRCYADRSMWEAEWSELTKGKGRNGKPVREQSARSGDGPYLSLAYYQTNARLSWANQVLLSLAGVQKAGPGRTYLVSGN